MKKLFALLFVFAIIGCGPKETPPTTPSTPAETPAEDADAKDADTEDADTDSIEDDFENAADSA